MRGVDTQLKLISYDCSHYIHHFKSDEMHKEILELEIQLNKKLCYGEPFV